MKKFSAATLAVILLAGCASEPKQSTTSWMRTGDPVADGKAAINQGPAKDKVLWQYKTALAALRRNKYDEAKALLDDALLTIGAIYGKDKSARKSRGYFSEEAKKNFLGEPYERVMAYYYRGILYWMDGESDNARACFRSAQLADSDTESKEYASDYVLLDYLDGLVSRRFGSDGAEALQRAQAEAHLQKPPPYDTSGNTLFFVEFGQGPTKYASGQYSEELRFREGHSVVRGAMIKIGDQSFPVGIYDDLNFQATTRGGRLMDHVLANKAVFKSATDNFGNAALIGGAVVGTTTRNGEVALGLVAAGLISKIVAASTTPAADIRCWDTLPQFLGFSSINLPPGQHTATVEFLDGNARPLPSLTKKVDFTVPPAGRESVVFVSDHS
jgi:hypothetical protein